MRAETLPSARPNLAAVGRLASDEAALREAVEVVEKEADEAVVKVVAMELLLPATRERLPLAAGYEMACAGDGRTGARGRSLAIEGCSSLAVERTDRCAACSGYYSWPSARAPPLPPLP